MLKKTGIFIFLISSLIKMCYSQYLPEMTESMIAEVSILPQISGDLENMIFKKIYILGDKIVIPVTINGCQNSTNISLSYKTVKMKNFQDINFMPKPDGNVNYSGKATIMPYKQALGPVQYYISMHNIDGHTVDIHGSAAVPKKIMLVQENKKVFDARGGMLVLGDGNPYDGENTLNIKKGALEKSITISFKQHYPVPDESQYKYCAAVYELQPGHLVFKDYSRLSLLYFDLDNDGCVDGDNVQEDELKMCWYDGFEWRNIGGHLDTKKNILEAKIIQTGVYALIPASKINAVSIKPLERIISPNGDGVNDYLFFMGLYGNFKITITDINGNQIRSETLMPYWDGKNNNDQYVPSGIYLYEAETGTEKVRGICAVAR